MLFNSIQFLVFFSIVTAAYFAIPHRWRWLLLIAASCYFYMVLVPEYILILFFLVLVDYIAGILIERSRGGTRKMLLVVSLIANIGTLAIFKYYNFFNDNLGHILDLMGWHNPIGALRLVLPIGLSFHTFQSMSYTIEVYRGRYRAERHLGKYALYVLFYPQMVAGPIERPQNLLAQLRREQSFDYQRVADGLKLMVWGFIKKIVVADRLAILVNTVYDHPSKFQGLPLILATYFFSFQIYCDFSGYSDIAIGAARVMGIRLMKNFENPYSAQSIGEFWKRWHISLSSWFRDYLYIPLGGKRVPIPRWYFNLFLVFLVSGLWHGANWTFIIWGGLHGLYYVCSALTQNLRERLARSLNLGVHPSLQKVFRILLTFHLVTFSWIFFRAKSLADAWYIISQSVRWFPVTSLVNMGLDRYDMVVAVVSIAMLELIQLLQRQQPILQRLDAQPVWMRWALYGSAVTVIVLFGKFVSLDFIYFQF